MATTVKDVPPDVPGTAKEIAPVPTPRLGDVVLYYVAGGPARGKERAALVTGLVGDGLVNLYVLLDGTADATVVTPYGPLAGVREEAVRYAPALAHEFGTWHPREA